ncbi:hypothetical protein HK099_002915 [Clydaea vesicula]|uniref:C2H2-type domain-containing protein n=1 Tax=Clydaea vesicula TaxID=447962 RepID=A0AAD5UAG5_9FUNG|nr:hypothetical protein HK099_002915 [Clydaea vesicula]KAJ3395692.1 hypothetical protein HDU92_005158 [Lobulomyces angularis]
MKHSENSVHFTTAKRDSLSFGFDITQLTKESKPILPLPSFLNSPNKLYGEVREPESYFAPSQNQCFQNFQQLSNNTFIPSISSSNSPLSSPVSPMLFNFSNQPNISFLNLINAIKYETPEIAVDEPLPKKRSRKKNMIKLEADDASDKESALITPNSPPISDNEERKYISQNNAEEENSDVVIIPSPILITVGKSTVYQCPFNGCNKTFTRPYNLKSHYIAQHTNKRPFKCDKCKQTFVRKNDYQRHSKLHNNQKPYECANCQKKFVRGDALKRHKMSTCKACQ